MPRRGQTAAKSGQAAVPARSCVACRQVKAKGELVRLVARAGRVTVDATGRAAGRGAYLCRDPSCWAAGEKRRALDRALRVVLHADDWRRIREGILS